MIRSAPLTSNPSPTFPGQWMKPFKLPATKPPYASCPMARKRYRIWHDGSSCASCVIQFVNFCSLACGPNPGRGRAILDNRKIAANRFLADIVGIGNTGLAGGSGMGPEEPVVELGMIRHQRGGTEIGGGISHLLR